MSIGNSTTAGVLKVEGGTDGELLTVDSSGVSIGNSTTAGVLNVVAADGDLLTVDSTNGVSIGNTTTPVNLNVSGDLTVRNKLIEVKWYQISAPSTEEDTDYRVSEWVCVIAGFSFQLNNKRNQVNQLSVYTEKDDDTQQWKIKVNSPHSNGIVNVSVMAISTKIAQFLDP